MLQHQYISNGGVYRVITDVTKYSIGRKYTLETDMLTTHTYCDMQMSKAYPQSTSLCEPTTVSEVAGGGGTEVTCCQAGTKICCARLDQACSFPKKRSRHFSDVLSQF